MYLKFIIFILRLVFKCTISLIFFCGLTVFTCFINQAVTFNLPRLPLSSLDPLCDRNEDENEEIIFSFGWNIFLKGQFTPKNTYYLDPVDLHCMGKNCLNILQNILFCVPQKKERHSGLK